MIRQRLIGFCLITGRRQTVRNNCPCFVWRFYSGQSSIYLTTTATSEREARLQLPAVRLVFVARIRVEELHHV
ncbi:host cell division inhibitor Icd-like protein [Salmonella enterica]|nr:host cell division inhibitor Icd-like protein [Salmonella enterica]EKB5473485.1 host cell division inhibitor Icd-like protein [Salmonella enterica]EKC2613392.1 host cell division inhibitor Icd-like protein [Salmonella enterica]EKC2691727.1 host cell division inhibitor Icd-like protein [Salmonella enterica]ELL0513203.1 host cell division inhibitor Icd-like protein [Salmonella enterica]